MKKNILSLLFILIFVGYSAKASAQDSLKTQPKNTIYASGTIGWWFTASASYERQLFTTDNKFYENYYLRARGGFGFASFGGDGPYGSLSLQGVFGVKKSHLELGLGFAALFDIDGYDIEVKRANAGYSQEPSRMDYTMWAPDISVGYRYQKPTGGFVFRTGIGYPEGVYISLGFAF